MNFKKYYLKYGAILLILAFATTQYFLLLRHKSPYLSDSYFYKHIYYQMKGESFDEAREKIVDQIDITTLGPITSNIFEKEKSYKNSYTFFTKRPLYPFSAYLLNFLISSEFINFLIPVFLSYVAVIILIYYFSKEGLNYLFAIVATALFIAFYPFLDWSTYFLTDTIGAFFWLLQLFFIYKFFTQGDNNWLAYYSSALVLSLFNREQSILMLPLFILLLVLAYIYKFKRRVINQIKSALLATLIIVTVYIGFSIILEQRTIIDTISYTQNSYGLESKKYTFTESFLWVKNQVIISHIAFIRDLVRHHWWFTFAAIAALGVLKTLTDKDKRLIDLLIIASGISSYLAIYIYPVLSYRFFFPLLLTIIFFSMKFTKNYFEN